MRSGEYTKIARNRNSVLLDAFERNPIKQPFCL